MDVTGERYLPELNWPEISYEHWHRYLWAAQMVAGQRVLDVGCGDGYGSNVLAQHAQTVLGVDADAVVIAHATAKYVQPNLSFLPGSAQALPVEQHEAFDAVVGFEMIEHLTTEGQHAFLAEVKRVLQPEGVFIVSTPDKRLYSDETQYVNAFHVHELYVDEFTALLKESFKHIYLLGQKVFPTSHIWPLQAEIAGVDELQLQYTDGHFAPGSDDQKQALFVIAVCSDLPLAHDKLSLLLDTSGQVTFRTHHAVVEQEQLLAKQRADTLELQGMVVARDEQLAKNAHDIAQLQQQVTARDEQLAKNAHDIAQLQQQVTARDGQLTENAHDISKLQGALTDRNRYVAEQHTLLEQQHAQLQKNAVDIGMLQGMIVERDAQIQKDATDILAMRTELEAFRSSVGGRVLMKAWRMRQRMLPSESTAARRARLAWRAARMLRRDGLRATVRHGGAWLHAQRERRRTPALHPHTTGIGASAAQTPDTYQSWLAEHTPSDEALQQQRKKVREFADQPLISIIVLVDPATPTALRATLASLREQTYEHWECWLVTSIVAQSVLQDAIAPAVQHDERIHTLCSKEASSAAQINAALAQIRGTWLNFVGAGDQLSPNALFAAISLLNEQPTTDVIYADSDHMQGAGRAREPFFKPDWSPMLLLSLNYLAGLTLVRASSVRAVSGVEALSGNAWLWDLLLRVTEHTQAVTHAPQLLYHHADSAFMNEGITPDGQAAVLRHMRRQGIQAEVVPHPYTLHLHWGVPAEPLVSIIIPSRNAKLVERCVRSIDAHTAYRSFEVIVVDSSHDGAIAAQYESDSTAQARVIRYTEPFNYSFANNLAAREARGELLLFLNDDIEAFEAGWLDELVRWVLYDKVGVVGAQLLRSDQRLQHAGVVIGLHGFAGHPFDGSAAEVQTIFGSPLWYRNYSAVTGACLMIRRNLFVQVGGFDEDMILCGSDVELCLQATAAGYHIVYTPFARLYHLESATRGTSAIPPMDFAHSYACYLPLLDSGDPFYNTNVSAWSSQPQLRQRNEVPVLDHVYASLRQLGVAEQADLLRKARRAEATSL